MMEIGRTIRCMDLELGLWKTDVLTRASLKITRSRALESLIGKMAGVIKESITIVKRMDLEFINGQMDLCMKDNGKTVIKMGKEYSNIKIYFWKESGLKESFNKKLNLKFDYLIN